MGYPKYKILNFKPMQKWPLLCASLEKDFYLGAPISFNRNFTPYQRILGKKKDSKPKCQIWKGSTIFQKPKKTIIPRLNNIPSLNEYILYVCVHVCVCVIISHLN